MHDHITCLTVFQKCLWFEISQGSEVPRLYMQVLRRVPNMYDYGFTIRLTP